MFDLPLNNHPTTGPQGFSPVFAVGDTDLNHPFALTLSRRAPADLMSGQAAVRALHPDTRAVRGFRTTRKRFYRQMLCAHAARQAAGEATSD